MDGHEEVMNGLRARVRQAVGDNALAMQAHGVVAGPATRPERQWWNLPAKYAAAQRIKEEALATYPGHNDAGDALRHAELSRRLASEIDPTTAYLAGVTHELENTIPETLVRFAPSFMRAHAEENWRGQGAPERLMDGRNNAEGRRAAREHRPVDPTRLQTSPMGPAAPGAPYQRKTR